MKRRMRVPMNKSKKIFKKTANKTHKANLLTARNIRGGIRW